ncbi:polysaccharide deacetylase family protein [Halorubrum sp. DTA98]|uniref:polysaccharide deacetylase family protein n=1 Tax=Halorubrum sp. DTA98 TaxID=3402163 RepID=UPI003AABE35F
MGTVVLSIDAELGWGHHDLTSPPAARLESGRDGWATLLELLDTYRIPATWAVVGHLFLEECDRAHATHPIADEWFERERTEWDERPDLRFAPDLVRAIHDADVDHDIGCHTFSHVDFGNDATTPEIARAELVASLEAAGSSSVPAAMTSVVFPHNNVGHRDVLAEWGFTCYRGVGPNGEPTSALRTIGNATVGTPPLVEPTVDEFGLVNVPASIHLYGLSGPARRVCERLWEDPILAVVRRGIDAATKGDGVFHVWLRPNDLMTDADVERLQTVLAYVARRRELSGLDVRTMRDVSQRTVSRTRPAMRT